tara:strand:+ start:9 stop:710 length:702 start_codon:yes stop_codon:yes gene_type:complete
MAKIYEITNAEYLNTSKGLCIECNKKYIPPKSQKYCSTKCSVLHFAKLTGKSDPDHISKCVQCFKEYKHSDPKSVSAYCSQTCKKNAIYSEKKSDFSKKKVTGGLRNDGNKTTSEWMQGGVLLPQQLLDVLEFAPSNAIWEDIHEIDRIIQEELPVATYADGTAYVSEVPHYITKQQHIHELIMMDRGLSRKQVGKTNLLELTEKGNLNKYGKRKKSLASDEDESTEYPSTKD